MMWRLSHQYIRSAMDLTVGLFKAIRIVSQIYLLVMTNIVAMHPLKINQAAASHLLFPKVNSTGEYWLISKPIIGSNKPSLASTDSMITFTNIASAYSKMVNSDDALTDNIMCNLIYLMPLSGRYP